MNKTKINNNLRPLSAVEKIRAYRDTLYEKYIKTHKKLNARNFYDEMIEGRKCKHLFPKTA